MRTITYTILPGIGPRSIKRVGTLKDLLFAIPYLLSPKLLPPRQVLNDLLRTGVLDAGMSGGCRWPPFEISTQEYDELLAECTSTAAESLQQVTSPEWVQTYRDWSAWVLEYGHSVPAQEYLALLTELEQVQKRL